MSKKLLEMFSNVLDMFKNVLETSWTHPVDPSYILKTEITTVPIFNRIEV